jgi:hypothetical protein
MANDPRTGRAWTQLLALCKTSYPWICHLCGQAIPRGLPPNHPLAYEADHVLTVKARPDLAHNIHNLRPSHHRCNRYRNDRPLTPALIAEITARYTPTRPALTFFQGNP